MINANHEGSGSIKCIDGWFRSKTTSVKAFNLGMNCRVAIYNNLGDCESRKKALLTIDGPNMDECFNKQDLKANGLVSMFTKSFAFWRAECEELPQYDPESQPPNYDEDDQPEND
jgi:hypothetical protein